MALKWVHDEIHNFGGDKDRVTIMGQSAGFKINILYLKVFKISFDNLNKFISQVQLRYIYTCYLIHPETILKVLFLSVGQLLTTGRFMILFKQEICQML